MKTRGVIEPVTLVAIVLIGIFAWIKGPAVVATIKGDNRKVDAVQKKQDETKDAITHKQLEVVKDAHGDIAAVNAILNSTAPAERKVSEAAPFAQKADDKLTQVDGGLTFVERKYWQETTTKLLSDIATVRAQGVAEVAKSEAKSATLTNELTQLNFKYEVVEKELRKATDNLHASEAKYRVEAERAQFWVRFAMACGGLWLVFNYVLPAYPAAKPIVDLVHRVINPVFHPKG